MKIVGERKREIQLENLAAGHIENCYLIHNEPTVALNDKLEHRATKSKINEVAKMWREEYDLYAIAHHFKDNPDNILLIIIHLANEGRIKARTRGLLT